MSTVLFLMDAMRSDYISKDTTPFLWKCSKEGEYYKRVIPNFGFCERTEIFTGQTPKESGFFTAIGYDPNNSPFKDIIGLRIFSFIEELIAPRIILKQTDSYNILYRIYRKIFNKWIIRQTKGISPQSIPISLLKYWDLTEDKIDLRDGNAFNVPSIFSLLSENGKTYFYDSFTALNMPSNGSDLNRMQMVVDDIKANNEDFYLVYVSGPDYYGHKYGPDAAEFKDVLKQIDLDLKTYTNKILEIDPKANFIYLGDHGMATVNQYFDAEKEIFSIAKKHHLELKKDFIYFLDSTLIRLWFFTEGAKNIFEQALYNSPTFNNNGVFINENIANQEKIPWGDKRYGDMIWWANTGVLVFPDFFHRVKKYKGMHGYDPTKYENQGTCIVYGEGIEKREIKSIYLTDVFDIFKKLLINE
jgi:predicted AlkP superfamily pyrophosphatase or phosphodiesterase